MDFIDFLYFYRSNWPTCKSWVESKRKNLIWFLIKNLLLNNRFLPFICRFSSHNEKNSFTFYFFYIPLMYLNFLWAFIFLLLFFSSSILSSSFLCLRILNEIMMGNFQYSSSLMRNEWVMRKHLRDFFLL